MFVFFPCCGLSASTWGCFGIVYYGQVKHLSSEEIGVLQGLLRLVGFVTLPFWGYIADIIWSCKALYLFCNSLSMLSLLSLSKVQTFPSILGCVISMASFKSSGVLDVHVLDFLGEKHQSLYGKIRLMTAISWGLGAVVMGWITDEYGFEWNFLLFAIMMSMVLLVTAFGLPAQSKKEQAQYDRLNNNGNQDGEMEEIADQPQICTLIFSVLRLPVLVWLTEVAVISAGMSLVDSFLFVFLQSDLKGNTRLCGYSIGVTVLFEVPVFHYSKYLLKEWGMMCCLL